jgi:23S rRNA pseudouridine1911/1915/1917 synthase
MSKDDQQPPSSQDFNYSRGFDYGVKHFLSPKTDFITKVISETLLLSLDQAQLLINIGAIYLNNRRVLNDQQVLIKDYLRVHTKPRRFNFANFNWSKVILFENEDCVIINKPTGIPCHPSVDNQLENVLKFMTVALSQELFIVNRLDVPTHGVLVLAKTKKFVKHFNSLLAEHQVIKIYKASVKQNKNAPPLTNRIYTHYMKPSPRAPKIVVDSLMPDYDPCDLEILNIENSLSEASTQKITIRLITGRTHQIRAQLSHLGYPINGDLMYGSTHSIHSNNESPERIELQCFSLTFKLSPWAEITSTFNAPS